MVQTIMRVDEGAHHADQARLRRVLRLAGRLGDAGGAEACLVREDAPRHAVAHGEHDRRAGEAACRRNRA